MSGLDELRLSAAVLAISDQVGNLKAWSIREHNSLIEVSQALADAITEKIVPEIKKLVRDNHDLNAQVEAHEDLIYFLRKEVQGLSHAIDELRNSQVTGF